MNFHDHHQAIVVRDPGANAANERVAVVAEVHAEIDQHTRVFAQQTGIACPEGCGRCCHSPEVETTVADLLPLAMELFRRGEANAVLERIEAQGSDASCVLFDADANDESRGRCSMYEWRPSICRLFGFAGRRDADGNATFSACRVHTQVMPDTIAAAKHAIAEGRIALPILSDLAGHVRAVAPGGASAPLPINVALREAINAAGLQAWLTAAQQQDDDTDGTTPTPRIPPRQAA